MKIGAIVQARTGSTRLPEKVLKELPFQSGITVLEQVIRRLKLSVKIQQIIIATTTDENDKKILEIARKENVSSFVGSEDDVLSRYYFSAKENNIDVIVRVTSDCPCIDPEIIDLTIEKHLEEKSDYTSNCLERSFPHGLDTEVISFAALEKAYLEASEKFEREHVCPYFYKSKPELFKITSIIADKTEYAPEIRLTLDTQEDYILLCVIFDFLFLKNNNFRSHDLISLFKQKPWLKLINEKIIQKKVYLTIEEEMKEAIKLLDLQGLNNVKKYLEAYENI